MKRKLFAFTLLIALLFSAVIIVSADDQLAEIKARGELKFGTSAEYIPFVFYDDAGILTGIDVELVKEIGRRIGVAIKSYDIAFDGLIDAVNVGQVDLIGGGFSKTDARAQIIDYSRTYYMGNAEMIVLAGKPVPDNVTLESFRGIKIGVQRGTTFDQWITTNLITGGYVSTQDVFKYAKEAQAMEALDRKDIEMVMMDQDVFEKKYQSGNKYTLFADNFAKENYAFASKKGSNLIGAINQALSDMITDGTAQQIANKFFQMNFNSASVIISRSNQVATATPVPAAAPAAKTCANAMTFNADVTIKDGSEVSAGSQFTKTWRVYNNGSCAWDRNYSFVFVSGDPMDGQTVYIDREVKPGQTYDISVPMRAPTWNGTFKANWQMRSPWNANFGESIWVKIRVKNAGQPPKPAPTNPVPIPVYPTQPPVPVYPTQPPAPVKPVITQFEPDYYQGDVAACPVVYWSTDKTLGVSIYVDGALVSEAPPSGSGYFCNWDLNNAGPHVFSIMAYNNDGTTTHQFTYQTYYTPEPVQPPSYPPEPIQPPSYPPEVPGLDEEEGIVFFG